MTAVEGSYLGLAQQSAFGSEATSGFKYMLFRRGSFGPNNVVLPLGPEVGGGAFERSVVKVGVTTGGALQFTPRPDTIGEILAGTLGDAAVSGTAAPYTHTFTLGTDEFSVPYYTYRLNPGGISNWGEVYPDCVVSGFSLDWRAPGFVNGTVAVIGREPSIEAASGWSPTIDDGPQFLTAADSAIELPTSTAVKVLAGSFAIANIIPLDQQWVVGADSPGSLDIVHRTAMINLVIKIDDKTLYEQMLYDPASSGAWVAKMYRESDFLLKMESDQIAGGTTPHSITIKANGQTEASGDANVIWTATPLDLIAQRQIVMNVSGMYIASPTVDETIEIELVNDIATDYV